TPQVWLDHQVTDQGEGLSWTWDVVEEVFPAGLADAMFAAYRSLLEHLAAEGEEWQGHPGPLVPPEQLAARAATG
ncbi:MAG TPA: hypothetical protein DD490_19560, partial [Acidobacteria bacterium]|nr:hypothetical protein [Acidobacteriota bacterium]